MQAARGRAHMAVAEQALNGMEVDASFEQMGGEAVSQGANAALGGEPGGIARRPVDALRCCTPIGPLPEAFGNSRRSGRAITQV
jgi:hypothetical protein